MMCTFLVQVTVEANHPIAERYWKCWHTGDSHAGTSSPMQIFVKTLTGKTITLDPWWISKFQAAGCSLRHVSGARSCKVMSCFVASHTTFSSLVPVARHSHPYLVENGIFLKLMPKWPRWMDGFNFLWPSILRSTAYFVKWPVLCVCCFSESPTTSKHFTAIIRSESWSDGPELFARRLCRINLFTVEIWQLYVTIMTCKYMQ